MSERWHWVTAANAEWIVMMGIAAIIMTVLFRRHEGNERVMALGMILIFLTTIFHASFWLIANALQTFESPHENVWRDSYWIFKIIVVQISVIGIALVLSPLLKTICGPQFWWWPFLALAVFGFVFGWTAHINGLWIS